MVLILHAYDPPPLTLCQAERDQKTVKSNMESEILERTKILPPMKARVIKLDEQGIAGEKLRDESKARVIEIEPIAVQKREQAKEIQLQVDETKDQLEDIWEMIQQQREYYEVAEEDLIKRKNVIFRNLTRS